MPSDSLKKLLDMFPRFFDKSVTSNFYKSQSVTNNQFKKIYQSIREVKDSFNLDKKCLIWKDQVEAYNYVINFVVNYPHLKSVKCYKNDTLIYSEDYTYDDNVNAFDYSYEGTTLNGTNDSEIIPTDTFHVDVETYEEYSISKGFPENDTLQGNIYDHDNSLDIIGVLHNIPRKNYILVDDMFLPGTEPPYNNRLSEDDYHYMNRIINYLIKIHTLPLPVAEVWKIYGFEPVMESRDKYILKFFDLNKHPNFIDENSDGDQWYTGTLDNNGNIIDWTPQPWEHNDKFYDESIDYGEYLFVKASTKIPVKNQDVIFKFFIMNCFGEKLTKNYTVDIELNGTSIESNHPIDTDYVCTSDLIDDTIINNIKFTCKNEDDEIIGIDETLFSVRGCNNADWYVKTTGDDSNTGRSDNESFATINKAVNSVRGDRNLIAIKPGTYQITEPIHVPESCTLLGCGEVIIENTENNEFFTMPTNRNLILQDMTLKSGNDTSEIDNIHFKNNNETRIITIVLDDGVETT